jgi:hypothetical protein
MGRLVGTKRENQVDSEWAFVQFLGDNHLRQRRGVRNAGNHGQRTVRSLVLKNTETNADSADSALSEDGLIRERGRRGASE